jgi:hypothetical protein
MTEEVVEISVIAELRRRFLAAKNPPHTPISERRT